MDTLVIDASIGAKWFFEEEDADKASWYLARLNAKKVRMVVPEFFYSEFANVCWKKVCRKEINVSQALKILEQIFYLPLVKYSDSELSDVALENALQYKISVYDALYLSLAEIYFSPFVTADNALFNACKGKFNFIEHLSEVNF